MKFLILQCILKCIPNNCKPPQNIDFPETALSFRFIWLKWFHGFVILARWEDRTYCLSSVFFGHKNGSSCLEHFEKKLYQIWPAAVEKLKKHENAPTRTQKKSQILLRRFLDEYT